MTRRKFEAESRDIIEDAALNRDRPDETVSGVAVAIFPLVRAVLLIGRLMLDEHARVEIRMGEVGR